MKPPWIGMLVLFLAASVSTTRLDAQAAFIRGDFNADRFVDIGDAVLLLFHLYLDIDEPPCLDAGDVNADAALNVADVVTLLAYLFAAAEAPAAPFPDCGVHPNSGGLGCAGFDPCAASIDGPPEITEWTVPWPNTRPRDPYVGPDGKIWFVGQQGNYAAYLDAGSGEFTRFNLPSGAGPHNLIVGDAVWYAGNTDRHIGRLDPETGQVERFYMPQAAAGDPHTLIFNRDGDIWFTVQQGNFIGKLTQGGSAEVEIRLVPSPTANSRPYGIALDLRDHPWVALFGTYKLAHVDPQTFQVNEIILPRTSARPRRIEVTSDDRVWYGDYAQGYLGRLTPASGEIREWRMPSGASARPYAMAVDDRDRVWFVETGPSPNRIAGFNQRTEQFFGSTPIPSGAGAVRHMHFDPGPRVIWFGTDYNTIGRARIP